jgi:hypothetical protein
VVSAVYGYGLLEIDRWPIRASRFVHTVINNSLSSRRSSLRRACVAAAACAVVGMADGGMALAPDAVAAASRADDGGVVVDARGAGPPPRWSDRRRCPPWRGNTLENVVPENLPRPSPQRRFNSVTAAGGGPALAPDAFLARRSSGMGCFSL